MKKLYYDMEIYKDFWLVVFKGENGKKIILHSRMDFKPALQRLKDNLENFVFVGFNNLRYDTVMLNYLLQNMYTNVDIQCTTMYKMSKEIVETNAYFKKVMADNRVGVNTYEMDVSNYLNQGMGAKEMACRLHHPLLETLPIHPDKNISEKDVETLITYCENDVDIVIAIYDLVGSEMDTVWDVIDYFGLDKSECSNTVGAVVENALVDPTLKPNPPNKFRYKSPVTFNFKTQQFKDVEETYKGLMLEPKSTFKMKVDVGDMDVVLGLGGIHGAVKQNNYTNLIDIDAKQYYPEQIDKYDQMPNTVKDKRVMRKLIDDKERFGEMNDPRETAVKKGINSIFGRMGFPSSKLYAPDKLYSVTITGQLLLLRLTEDLREAGYEVVYLNTDGLTILDNGTTEYKEICDKWAEEFGFKLKLVPFKQAYYRDVNNFIIEDGDGNLKRKGDFDTSTNKKRSAFAKVAVDAVVEHLLYGEDIRDYIHKKNDLRDFMMYHKYNHNMDVFLLENGRPKKLSNVVRYYLAKDKDNAILHKKEGSDTFENRSYNNNVSLCNSFSIVDGNVVAPADLDKEAYVKIAYEVLQKITGVDVEDNPYIDDLLKTLEEL